MKLFIYSVILLICSSAYGQKINYNIPQGYETQISNEDYKKIVDISIAVISKRYRIDNVKDGSVFLEKGQGGQAFNLHNLISKCIAIKDKSLWEKEIQSHFNNIFISIDEQKKIDPTNYETIKKYLTLRIYRAEVIDSRGGSSQLVIKTDLEGTYTVLMLDLPGAFTPVLKQAYLLWNKDSVEVFKMAQSNINKQQVQKVTQKFDIDGSNIEISFIGEEDYAASYALDLITNSPEMIGEWGSAIALPNKGIVDICKISKDKPLDFVKFIQRMKPRVEKSYLEHDQPISDQFFWYYKGTFTRIMVMQKPDGSISVISPSGLTALMTK